MGCARPPGAGPYGCSDALRPAGQSSKPTHRTTERMRSVTVWLPSARLTGEVPVTVQLAPSSDSAHLARVAVAAVLTRLGRLDLIDDVTTVTSELVANGVLHAHTGITLTIESLGNGVRVTVADGSPVLPRWSPASLTGTSGRGLMLVDRLSSTWGAQTVPGGGKIV